MSEIVYWVNLDCTMINDLHRLSGAASQSRQEDGLRATGTAPPCDLMHDLRDPQSVVANDTLFRAALIGCVTPPVAHSSASHRSASLLRLKSRGLPGSAARADHPYPSAESVACSVAQWQQEISGTGLEAEAGPAARQEP